MAAKRKTSDFFDTNPALAMRQMMIARDEGEGQNVREKHVADVSQDIMLAHSLGVPCEDCPYSLECGNSFGGERDSPGFGHNYKESTCLLRS